MSWEKEIVMILNVFGEILVLLGFMKSKIYNVES